MEDAVLLRGGGNTGLQQLAQWDVRLVSVKQELADATEDAEEKQELVDNLFLSENAKMTTIDECRTALRAHDQAAEAQRQAAEAQRARIAELEAQLLRERRNDDAGGPKHKRRKPDDAAAEAQRTRVAQLEATVATVAQLEATVEAQRARIAQLEAAVADREATAEAQRARVAHDGAAAHDDANAQLNYWLGRIPWCRN